MRNDPPIMKIVDRRDRANFLGLILFFLLGVFIGESIA